MRTLIAWLAVAAAARINELGRFADDAGASLVEYALIMGLVSIAAFAALVLLGGNTTHSLSNSASLITS